MECFLTKELRYYWNETLKILDLIPFSKRSVRKRIIVSNVTKTLTIYLHFRVRSCQTVISVMNSAK